MSESVRSVGAYTQVMSRKALSGAIFAIAAVSLGFYFSLGPWRAYGQQKGKADAATQEMQKAERAKTDLLQQEAEAQDPIRMEQRARERGFVKKGESPLR